MTRNPIRRWMTQAVSLKTGQQVSYVHATSDIMWEAHLAMARKGDMGWRMGCQGAGKREVFCVFPL